MLLNLRYKPKYLSFFTLLIFLLIFCVFYLVFFFADDISAVSFTSYLYLGLSGDEVTHLQELLAKDPSIYPEGLVTGYFGPLTEEAVRRFQKKHGLETWGVVGPQTRALLNKLQKQKQEELPTTQITQEEAQSNDKTEQNDIAVGYHFTRYLEVGSHGKEVSALQEFLSQDKEIYPEGLVTGYFGPLTEEAVRRFQKKNGIEALGVVGPQTRKVLNNPQSDPKKASTVQNKQTNNQTNDSVAQSNQQQSFIPTSSNTGSPSPNVSPSPILTFSLPTLAFTSTPTVTVDNPYTALFSWKTNTPSDSKIFYSTSTPITSSNVSTWTESTLKGNHSLGITVFASTTYYYYVSSTDERGNTVTSGTFSFSTPAPTSPPTITNNSFILFEDKSIRIDGQHFDTNPDDSDHFIKFTDGVSTYTVPSNDNTVTTWNDNKIVLSAIPSGVDSDFTVQVHVAQVGDFSAKKPVDVYSFTQYSGESGSTPYLLDVDLDTAQTTVWASAEFFRYVHSFNPSTDTEVQRYIDTQHPTRKIFQSALEEGLSRNSDLSEKVFVDANDDVWYSQGGEHLYSGTATNSSRIIKFDPDTETNTCYNIPENNVQVAGFYVDDDSGWVYGTTNNATSSDYIFSFKPSTFTGEQDTLCTYDFRSDPIVDFCGEGESEQCFIKYDLGDSGLNPAHITKDSNGDIWFTNYIGRSIGRLATSTETYTEFPLPSPRYSNIFAPGPWDLEFNGNDLWFVEFFDSQIGKFDTSLIATLGCTTLDVNGNNPCITYYTPDSDYINIDIDRIHSLTIDSNNNVWFSIFASNDSDDSAGPYLGRIDSTGQFQFSPSFTEISARGFSGIEVSSVTNDIWIAISEARKLGRFSIVE